MEMSEIEKQLADFEKTLVPVKKGETTLKAEAPKQSKVVPMEALAPVQPAAAPGKTCFNPCFVDMVKNIKPAFFGNEVGDIVMMLLDQFPLCESGIGVAS